VEAIDSEKRFQSLAQDAVEELYRRGKRLRNAAYRALLITASAILLPPIVLLLFGPSLPGLDKTAPEIVSVGGIGFTDSRRSQLHCHRHR
jgi:hypothetical protein